jgi:hypothetical protein
MAMATATPDTNRPRKISSGPDSPNASSALATREHATPAMRSGRRPNRFESPPTISSAGARPTT